ncbi:MAG: glycoside hydrolase family 3 N-terminal domain-containing protein, partial [Muribaculaceae bacterium]
MLIKLIASSIAAMMAIGQFSAKTPIIERRSQYPGLEQWVDSVFFQLNEREKVSQLMMPVLAPADTVNLEGNLKILVGEEHVGGLLVSKGTAAQYAATVNRAQELSKVPLMISIDGEWGVSMRVTDALLFPRNLIVGAVADDHLVYQYGREIARQCRLLGINVDFAPVLDVNTNPLNPVIGDRSLGESARNVYRKGLTIAKGIEDGGVLSVAKHFPGHGSTSEDSHKTLPVVDKSLRDLQMVDLLPFRKYIDSGLGGVLT